MTGVPAAKKDDQNTCWSRTYHTRFISDLRNKWPCMQRASSCVVLASARAPGGDAILPGGDAILPGGDAILQGRSTVCGHVKGLESQPQNGLLFLGLSLPPYSRQGNKS